MESYTSQFKTNAELEAELARLGIEHSATKKAELEAVFAERETLEAIAADKGIEFTEASTDEELVAAITGADASEDDADDAQDEAGEDESEDSEETTDEDDSDEPEASDEPEEEIEIDGESVSLYNSNGVVKETFSQASHGDDWEEQAKARAKATGYKVA